MGQYFLMQLHFVLLTLTFNCICCHLFGVGGVVVVVEGCGGGVGGRGVLAVDMMLPK